MIGDNIMEQLVARGMTQKQLAAETGINIVTLNNYVRNRRRPDLNALQKISRVFGCTPQELSNGQIPYISKNFIWIEVTRDKLELPINVADTAQELAEICGVTKDTVASYAYRYSTGEYKRSRFMKVEVEDDSN